MQRPKPRYTPTWATSGERVEPPEEKKAQGFVPGERAHAQYFNWLFHTIGDWLRWVNGVFPTPLSKILGRRYLSIGSDTQIPGLELHAGDGERVLGEVQWSDRSLTSLDKRVAGVVGSTDAEQAPGCGRLDFHARGKNEGELGTRRMSLDSTGLRVEGHLRADGDIVADGMLQFRPPSTRDDYVHLQPGSQVFDATGRTWVGVLVHELKPELAGITGGTRGQLLVCEFVHGSAEAVRTFRFRHQAPEMDSPHDRFQMQELQDRVVVHAVPHPFVCLFVHVGHWRLLAVNL